MPANIPRQYVLVRTDLPVTTQVVQVAHACVTAGHCFALPEYHHLVLLAVRDEWALRQAAEMLEADAGIRHTLFHEPDGDTGFTSLCTEPVSGQACRFFRRFTLWQPPTA
ncbi:MAG TPA: hypothetical protein VN837_05780 [Chloroflexota bacterium]|nr:hypothetical protein [Chloroflexota bacterium]